MSSANITLPPTPGHRPSPGPLWHGAWCPGFGENWIHELLLLCFHRKSRGAVWHARKRNHFIAIVRLLYQENNKEISKKLHDVCSRSRMPSSVSVYSTNNLCINWMFQVNNFLFHHSLLSRHRAVFPGSCPALMHRNDPRHPYQAPVPGSRRQPRVIRPAWDSHHNFLQSDSCCFHESPRAWNCLRRTTIWLQTLLV